MKSKFLLIFPASALILFLTVYGSNSKPGEEAAKGNYQTVLRMVGHRLLLSAGDGQSRVMPVKQLSAQRFQVHFERSLALESDSVYSIVSNAFKTYSLPAEYVANLLDCTTHEVVYSFAMTSTDSSGIVPCLGRNLPTGCYYLDINFSATGKPGSKNNYLIAGSVVLLGLLGFLLFPYLKRKKQDATLSTKVKSGISSISIGKYSFISEQRRLEILGEQIDLTDKESKLLTILAKSPNQVIEREQLQKEVWENEGVIVTRSLDVFISRLRKKLDKDPAIRLLNVHGKGYKLEVPA